jgi:hypothetical protein
MDNYKIDRKKNDKNILTYMYVRHYYYKIWEGAWSFQNKIQSLLFYVQSS